MSFAWHPDHHLIVMKAEPGASAGQGEEVLKSLPSTRVKASAKFFYRGTQKFWMRGVTYGTFEPCDGSNYPAPERVAQDFALMREAGINTVRVYIAPPQYLLDEAKRQ